MRLPEVREGTLTVTGTNGRAPRSTVSGTSPHTISGIVPPRAVEWNDARAFRSEDQSSSTGLL